MGDVQDLLLCLFQHAFYRWVMVELIPQRVVDAFVHPVFSLLVTFIVEVAILFGELHILSDHIPYFLDTYVVITGISQYFREPT